MVKSEQYKKLQRLAGKNKNRASKSGQSSAVKRTVKYISVCNDPTTYRSVVRSSNDSVIKTICNAALNVERGAIHLSEPQKKLFRKHRGKIAKLTSSSVGLPSKRNLIEQRGSGFFIPALIGAALSSLGGLIFGKK